MNDILSALPEEWRNRAIVFLVGALAGIGGFGWSGGFRSDPFTGEQGRELSVRIKALEDHVFGPFEKRIDAIEKLDAVTGSSVEACQAIAKQYGERLNYIERSLWNRNE